MTNGLFRHTGAAGIILAACVLAGGCTLASNLLNPDFLQTIGATQNAASLPGESPAIVIGVKNDTSRTAEFLITWRDADDNVEQQQPILGAGAETLLAVFCPVVEVTLGDVSDLSATGAVVRLGDGTLNDALIEVEPFGVLLQSGIHFDCGDRIVFSVRSSANTLSGFRVFAEIERAHAQGGETTDGSGTTP